MSEADERRREHALDQARIMRLPSGFGTRVEVLKATYQSQIFTRHTHDTYTLGMVLGGAGTFWCRGTEHFAGKGDIVAIPPGEVHTGSVGSGVDALSYLAIYLPVGLAIRHSESAGLRGGKPPEFGAVLFRDAIVRRAFEALNKAVGTVDVSRHRNVRANADDLGTLDEAAAEEGVCVAIAELMRGHAERSAPNETLNPRRGIASESRVVGVIRAVIEDSYSKPDQTSLHALAKCAGVTPFRVIRAFREATGLSPHHYLIQVRVERARRFLAEGAIPSMTALMTGFTDQSHLTYHFKKYLGITPANYQRCVTSR
jgi:AraC-like DNA-binding protein/mannose-6-phosphate isomerase-like protein (cupin superfamily)